MGEEALLLSADRKGAVLGVSINTTYPYGLTQKSHSYDPALQKSKHHL